MRPNLRRLAVFGVATLVIGLSGCQEGGQAPDSGIVQIRNITSSVIDVTITEPYSGTEHHGIPPFRPGDCASSYGTAPGAVEVAVVGPGVASGQTFSTTVPVDGQTWISVIVGASGSASFGHEELLPQGSCSAEQEVLPPAGY